MKNRTFSAPLGINSIGISVALALSAQIIPIPSSAAELGSPEAYFDCYQNLLTLGGPDLAGKFPKVQFSDAIVEFSDHIYRGLTIVKETDTFRLVILNEFLRGKNWGPESSQQQAFNQLVLEVLKSDHFKPREQYEQTWKKYKADFASYLEKKNQAEENRKSDKFKADVADYLVKKKLFEDCAKTPGASIEGEDFFGRVACQIPNARAVFEPFDPNIWPEYSDPAQIKLPAKLPEIRAMVEKCNVTGNADVISQVKDLLSQKECSVDNACQEEKSN